jgi:hypothetical protein
MLELLPALMVIQYSLKGLWSLSNIAWYKENETWCSCSNQTASIVTRILKTKSNHYTCYKFIIWLCLMSDDFTPQWVKCIFMPELSHVNTDEFHLRNVRWLGNWVCSPLFLPLIYLLFYLHIYIWCNNNL